MITFRASISDVSRYAIRARSARLVFCFVLLNTTERVEFQTSIAKRIGFLADVKTAERLVVANCCLKSFRNGGFSNRADTDGDGMAGVCCRAGRPERFPSTKSSRAASAKRRRVFVTVRFVFLSSPYRRHTEHRAVYPRVTVRQTGSWVRHRAGFIRGF